MNKKPKILMIDLETSPDTIRTYGTYNVNAISIVRPSHIYCGSYKWFGGDKTKCISQFDFPARFKNNPYDDYDVVKGLHELVMQADVTMAYNGDRFDNTVLTTRFLYYGLEIPPPAKSIDPLKTARAKLKLPNNKLSTVAQYFGLGSKTTMTNGQLWQPCEAGDKKAWTLMALYCNQDVDLLEQVYKLFRPLMNNHPNLSMISGDVDACPRCGSHKVISNGWRTTNATKYRRFKCGKCKAPLSDRKHAKEEYERSTYVNYT